MDKVIDVIRTARRNFLKLIDGLSLDELNKVPVGFNNNLMWHLGHLIASQQLLCYQYSNLTPHIDENYIASYRNGTRPQGYVEQAEFDWFKSQLLTLIDQLEADKQAGIFTEYNAYVSPSYGIAINNLDDVLKYICFHEGIHFGYAMVLKRVVFQSTIQ